MLEACVLRFRPIMMTTAAALLGALPLVLGRGTGSELRWPLGVTICGGLLLSQAITLYTTPSIYVAFEHLRARRRRGRVLRDGSGGVRRRAEKASAGQPSAKSRLGEMSHPPQTPRHYYAMS